MNILGERLKELRLEQNLSTHKLAKLIDFSNASISRWENGKSDIKASELVKFCKFFKVSADYLLGFID